MKKVFYISVVLMLINNLIAYGQDHQFSQYYSAPSYLAPSFCGGTKGSRVVLNYRTQWANISKGYRTFATSFDHYFPQHKSGLGVYFYRDIAGTSRLALTTVGLQYSYIIRASRAWYVRPGIQFASVQHGIDYSRLVFGDQISLYGIAPESVEMHGNLQDRVSYLDFCISALAYNDQYWGGMALDHLNTSNQSLMNKTSMIPITLRMFFGGKFVVNDRKGQWDEQSVTASLLYKAQGKYDQLDIGAYFRKLPMSFGFWYRGIPIFKRYAPGYGNSDALTFIVGYSLKDIKIGYSYDFTISRLVKARTGGSHEISIIYEFNQDQKPRKRRGIIVPCPKF